MSPRPAELLFDGTLTAETLAPDLLVSNPPAWFGAGPTRGWC